MQPSLADGLGKWPVALPRVTTNSDSMLNGDVPGALSDIRSSFGPAPLVMKGRVGMKAIFLDIDGVLNCDRTPNPRRFPYVVDKLCLPASAS